MSATFFFWPLERSATRCESQGWIVMPNLKNRRTDPAFQSMTTHTPENESTPVPPSWTGVLDARTSRSVSSISCDLLLTRLA